MPQPRLSLVSAAPSKPWSYIMLNDAEASHALDMILSGPKPVTTVRVWLAVVSLTDWNTGTLGANPPEVAEKAKVPVAEVRRALPHLVRLGILARQERGSYSVNPRIAWRGSLSARQRADARWFGE